MKSRFLKNIVLVLSAAAAMLFVMPTTVFADDTLNDNDTVINADDVYFGAGADLSANVDPESTADVSEPTADVQISSDLILTNCYGVCCEMCDETCDGTCCDNCDIDILSSLDNINNDILDDAGGEGDNKIENGENSMITDNPVTYEPVSVDKFEDFNGSADVIPPAVNEPVWDNIPNIDYLDFPSVPSFAPGFEDTLQNEDAYQPAENEWSDDLDGSLNSEETTEIVEEYEEIIYDDEFAEEIITDDEFTDGSTDNPAEEPSDKPTEENQDNSDKTSDDEATDGENSYTSDEISADGTTEEESSDISAEISEDEPVEEEAPDNSGENLADEPIEEEESGNLDEIPADEFEEENFDNSDDEIEKDEIDETVINVLLPASLSVVVNPYNLKIADNNGFRYSILSPEYTIKNYSNCDVSIAATVSASTTGGLVLSPNDLNGYETDFTAFVYIEATNESGVYSEFYSGNANQIAFSNTAVSKDILVLADGSNSETTGYFRIKGQASAPYDVSYSSSEAAINMVITFDISPVGMSDYENVQDPVDSAADVENVQENTVSNSNDNAIVDNLFASDNTADDETVQKADVPDAVNVENADVSNDNAENSENVQDFTNAEKTTDFEDFQNI